MEHIVFLTGRLAEKALERVLQSMEPAPFTWQVREIGVQVAALMTADLIRRRLSAPLQADRVIVPGRCQGDLLGLGDHFGTPFERGPEDLKDLPHFFNRKAKPVDLSGFDVAIFAEIVDAPGLTVDEILARGRRYRDDGADVILGACRPRVSSTSRMRCGRSRARAFASASTRWTRTSCCAAGVPAPTTC